MKVKVRDKYTIRATIDVAVEGDTIRITPALLVGGVDVLKVKHGFDVWLVVRNRALRALDVEIGVGDKIDEGVKGPPAFGRSDNTIEIEREEIDCKTLKAFIEDLQSALTTLARRVAELPICQITPQHINIIINDQGGE